MDTLEEWRYARKSAIELIKRQEFPLAQLIARALELVGTNQEFDTQGVFKPPLASELVVMIDELDRDTADRIKAGIVQLRLPIIQSLEIHLYRRDKMQLNINVVPPPEA